MSALAGLVGRGLVAADWAEALAPVDDVIARMGVFLREELAAGRTYLPSGERILRAFERPLSDVRVLVVGQDPYPTPGHAMGLSFSVAPDVRPIPRSLALAMYGAVIDFCAGWLLDLATTWLVGVIRRYVAVGEHWRGSGQDWAAYVMGVIHSCAHQAVAARADRPTGFDLLIETQLPEGKGVSSSAALEVSTMVAVAAAYGLPLGREEIAAACQRACASRAALAYPYPGRSTRRPRRGSPNSSTLPRLRACGGLSPTAA